jgi:outer membrane protein TolC
MKSKFRASRFAALSLLLTLSSWSAAFAETGSIKNSDSINKEPESIKELNSAAENSAFSAERLDLKRDSLKALITIDRRIDPFSLDAQSSRSFTLKEAIDTTLANNLDIGIVDYDRQAAKARLLGAYGKFLPDIALSYQYNYLKGKANVPFGSNLEPLRFNNPFIITSAGFKYYGYRGGSVLFSALKGRNQLRAEKEKKKATIADALRETVHLYNELILQEAILRIRIRAVETSESQLSLSRDLQAGGLATRLEVLQAETQLSQDRQNLIDQQIARRDAAIRLSDHLSLPQDVDLRPTAEVIEKWRLVSDDQLVGKLVSQAIDNRPELKQYEELRLAAKKQIVINAANLQPSFAFNGNVLGIGETLSKSTELAPVTLATVGGNSVAQVPRQRQITALYTLGFNVNWNFQGLGTVDAANIYAAKLDARKAALESQRLLNQVVSEVRRSYLKSLSSERKIEEAIAQVRSADEELRLASLRYQNGVGKNIDVLRAQQDYTGALIEKARALVAFNDAQVDLLRNVGLISSSSLLKESR